MTTASEPSSVKKSVNDIELARFNSIALNNGIRSEIVEFLNSPIDNFKQMDANTEIVFADPTSFERALLIR